MVHTSCTLRYKAVILLGIDIGGSGIKGGLVDLRTGELTSERYRIPTPKPATPEKVAKKIKAIQKHFHWHGPIGCTFPSIIKEGKVMIASNIPKDWVGINAENLFTEKTGYPTRVVNDADAAGLAELHFGHAHEHPGVVILLTFGTGIGSAFFVDSVLIPNTEFGHLQFKKKKAEWYCADRIRAEENLTWQDWARRVNKYLAHLELLFSPDLFIIGGGVANKPHKFEEYLEINTDYVFAKLKNSAGIVGAAYAASELLPAHQG